MLHRGVEGGICNYCTGLLDWITAVTQTAVNVLQGRTEAKCTYSLSYFAKIAPLSVILLNLTINSYSIFPFNSAKYIGVTLTQKLM